MKYGNHKVSTPDGVFDSKKEYNRWCELKLLEKAGEISDLQRQKKFLLLPEQKGTIRTERRVWYIADFVYMDHGELIVEDVKGFKTREYVLKRKMFKYFHHVEIREI